MSDLIEVVREKISGHLDGIKKLFKPGTKVTVIVRTPGHDTRDFVLTDDALSEVAELLRRRMAS